MPSTLAPPDTYTYPTPPAIPARHLYCYDPSIAPPIYDYTDSPSPTPCPTAPLHLAHPASYTRSAPLLLRPIYRPTYLRLYRQPQPYT